MEAPEKAPPTLTYIATTRRRNMAMVIGKAAIKHPINSRSVTFSAGNPSITIVADLKPQNGRSRDVVVRQGAESKNTLERFPELLGGEEIRCWK